MPYILYKLIKLLLLPPAWISIGLAGVFVLFFKNKNSTAKILLILVFLLYYLLSIRPVSDILTYSLEQYSYFPDNQIEQIDAIEAIVILSAGLNRGNNLHKEAGLSTESISRVFYGVKIYKRLGGAVPILFSGGVANPFFDIEDKGKIIKNYIKIFGVPGEDIIVETISRNTFESAAEVKKMLEKKFPDVTEHKIILVTSAIHMPRSEAVFKKQGFRVFKFPAGYKTGPMNSNPLDFIPDAGNFEKSTDAVYEWLGLVYYKLSDKI